MLTRMMGAAWLRPGTYEDVEADRSATGQALVVVLLASLAAGVGLPADRIAATPLALGTVGALIGWAAWAVLTYLIGTHVLPGPNTRADVGELLRTTGFAQAPGILRVLGAIPGLTVIAWTVASLWMLVATVVAVRQALDYTSTGRALAVCVTGWILSLLFAVGIGLIAGPEVS